MVHSHATGMPHPATPLPPTPDPVADDAIVAVIFELLATRREGATICPSEVARALRPGASSWRALMPQVRGVAQRLASEGRLQVTRRGMEVDATNRGGPVRLGRSRPA